MAQLEYFMTKKEVLEIISRQKTIDGGAIDHDTHIKNKLKLKKNRPPFVTLNITLDDGLEVKLQRDPSSEFETFSATLYDPSTKTWICRLDFHDEHRRKCKKEIGKYYTELHFHVHCDECLKERLKDDSMVLNISATKVSTGKFECFIKAFFDIIHLDTHGFDCGATLGLEAWE